MYLSKHQVGACIFIFEPLYALNIFALVIYHEKARAKDIPLINTIYILH